MDDNDSWRHFRRLNFDTKAMRRRMRRAETITTRHANKFILRRIDSIRESRREIITWLAIVGVMILGVILQFGWFENTYTTPAAAEGGSFAEATLGPIETLNPLYVSSDAELTASRLIFSSLFQYDTTGHLTGDLATSYSVSSDGKVYTVSLRPDAKWHDGYPVTANDVAFTINLIRNPNTRSSLATNWQNVTITAPSKTTVEFTLPAAYAAFPQALTFPILPEHVLTGVAPADLRQNKFSSAPVGSGPFEYVSSQLASGGGSQNMVVRLVANTSYYGGAPKLAHFDIHAFSDTGGILQALQTGVVNAASGLTPDNLSKIPSKRYTSKIIPIDSGVYSLFNLQNPILKDQAVRLALREAIDTNKLRQELPGNPPALTLPFVDGQLDNHSDLSVPPASTQKAADDLTAAGWQMVNGVRTKDGAPLHLTITTTTNPLYQSAAKIIQHDWRAIGVTSDLNVIDTTQPNSPFVQNVLQPRNFDVLIYELIIGADPDVFAYWSSSQTGINGYNFSNYSNPVADATLSSARSVTAQNIRQAKYHAFAAQWLGDVPAIGLYQGVTTYVEGHGIQTITPDMQFVSAVDRFANVLYWSSGSKTVYKTP